MAELSKVPRNHASKRGEPGAPMRLVGVRVLVLFGGSELFGQERANLEVIHALREIGLDARFVTSSRWGDLIRGELDRFGFQWVNAPFGFHWGRYLLGRYFYYLFRNLWGLAVTNWKVWREIRRWRPTHLYAPNWLHFTYVLPLMWFVRLPVIARVGDAPPATAVQRFGFRLWLRRCTKVVCISDFIGALTMDYVAPMRTRRIYSVPPRRRIVARDRARTNALVHAVSDLPTVLFVGQVAEFKGVGLLIEAAKHLTADGVNVTVLIAGRSQWNDDYIERLKRQIADSPGRVDVRFLGHIEDVPALFRIATVHVCPSVCREALGNVVLEAKEAGIPSVVFPDGGLPELVEHKVDGFICRECSPAGLAEGLRYFLTDTARAQAAGNAALRSLDTKFGLSRFQQQWAQVFLESEVNSEQLIH